MSKTLAKKDTPIRELVKNRTLYLMMLPAILTVLIFNYIPLLGITIAFKKGNTVSGFFSGDWIGFDNFNFFFKSQDAFRITWNTLSMNFIFIALGTVVAIIIALMLNELKSRMLIKIYQTSMLLPYFLSWVVMGFLSYAFLSVDNGFINNVIVGMGCEPIQWYSEPKYWPVILTIVNLIKSAGYNAVVYYAAILGIDQEMYEAARIDGATGFKLTWYITLPMIKPLVTVMILMSVGRIFYADFGLFYYIPRGSGLLLETTDVIDTYVFRALKQLGDTGMSAAIGLFQSIVGFILVLGSNMAVKKYDPDSALF